MNETDARCFTLIRALEESDPDGAVFPPASRRSATRDANPPRPPASEPGDPANEAFLVRRARLLCARLSATHPELARLAQPWAWRRWLLAGGITLGLIAGYSAAEFGPEQRLQLLSFPLVGLLVWNVIFYLALAAKAVFARRARSLGRTREQANPVWLHLWQRVRAWRLVPAAPTPPARGTAAFIRAWIAHTAPLRAAEARQALHAGAAALAVGLIAGLYVRGLVLEYRAGWESTFIDATTLERMLGIVFGPAAWLTGIPLPDATELGRLAWNAGGGENAARWIHLAAVTAGLFIIAPRLVLFGLAGRRADRLRRSLSVYSIDSYTHPLLQAGSGGGERAVLVPLGYQPSERTIGTLRDLTAALLGGLGRLDVLAPVPYGDEEVRLAALPAELSPPPAWLITVINLAGTPETETHGDWLRGLRALVDTRTLTRVLLLADDTAYRAVLDGADADRRLAERLGAWQSLAEVHGLAVVPIGEGRASAAKLARRVRRHAYPPVPAG